MSQSVQSNSIEQAQVLTAHDSSVDGARRSPSGNNEFSIRAVIAAIRWNAMPFAVLMVISWSLAALAIWLVPVSYEASTQVLLEPLPRKPVSVALDGLADPLDSAQADSRLQVVKSERLLRFVFDTIDWPRISGMQTSEGSAEAQPSLSTRLRSLLRLSTPSEEARKTRALIDFMDRIGVKRLGLSYVIEITFRAKSAKSAASVVNSITAAYLRSLVIASQYDGELLQRRVANVEQEKQTLLGAVKSGTIPDQNFPDANARVISAALEPVSKSSPKTFLILMMATALGLTAGFVSSLVRYRTDRTIRTGRESFIPSLFRLLGTFPSVRRHQPQGRAPSLAGSTAAISPLLLQELLRPRERGRHNIIGFIACEEQAGTSYVTHSICTNLRANKIPAKLVDASISANSSQTPPRRNKASPKMGLGAASLQPDQELSLETMIDPPKLRVTLKDLSREGPVLIDMPAATSSFDAFAVTPYTDFVVVVTKAGRTSVNDLLELAHSLPKTKIAGFLVNQLQFGRAAISCRKAGSKDYAENVRNIEPRMVIKTGAAT